MTRPLGLLLALGACRGGPDGEDADTGQGSSATPTNTDATFTPDAFGVREARFALQPDGRIGPTAAGTWSITVELVSTEGERCEALFSSTEAVAQPPFPGAPDVPLRVPRPADAPTGSCADADVPRAWGDVLEVLDAWAFEVGVTGSPTDDAVASLDPDELERLMPFLFGGGVHLAGVDGNGDGSADQEPWRPVGIAWSEDDEGALVPYTERVSNGEILPGTFVVLPQQYFQPARALLRAPAGR